MQLNLSTLKSKLVNISSNNNLIRVNPKSKYSFDISNIKIEEGCILTDDYNEYVKWWDKTIKLI